MKDLDFRVGDVVTSILHGVGVVINYHKGREYPVEVKFNFKNDVVYMFRKDGWYDLVSGRRILYHGEIYSDLYAAAEVKPVRINYKQRTLDKWFWFMMNPGKDSEDYINATGCLDELEILNNCWACELAKRGETFFVPDCFICPIKGFRDDRCYTEKSLYEIWFKNKTSENARKMYDTIFNTWEE